MAGALMLGGAAAAQSLTARYTDPTTRYAHGVLGDDVEYGALEIRGGGKDRRFVLPDHLVFEDIAPRAVDLDGDGAPEFITVESHAQKGARLAIWDDTGRIASTPFIGRANRWLAPVGAADLDGDGAIEIAYVDRPHLAKTLRIWRFANGRLTEIAALKGVSNHRIGWDYIDSGIRNCGAGPELVLASGDWRHVIGIRMAPEPTSRRIGPYAPGAIARALACKD